MHFTLRMTTKLIEIEEIRVQKKKWNLKNQLSCKGVEGETREDQKNRNYKVRKQIITVMLLIRIHLNK